MPKLRHALTGGVYELQSDGLVRVEENGRVGVFHPDGRWHSGELRQADPHLLGWLAGPQLASRGLPGRSTAPAAARPAAAAVRPASAPKAPGRRATGDDSKRRKGMDLGLEGRKAVVTAATRGIGFAIAELLAAEGADVALCARNEDGLAGAKATLEEYGGTVYTQALDVGDGAALRKFVAEAATALGGIDIMVCNASGGPGMGEAAWQANFEIDVLGAVRCVEAALPALSQSDGGSIVFISSTAALEYIGVPQPYNAMKAALIAHAGDLSQALAPQGVRVNVVSPGPIYFEGGNWQMLERAMPQIYERALAQCAIGRMGTPEEVARAVVFLASPAASLITGANLVCDGGFTKRIAY